MSCNVAPALSDELLVAAAGLSPSTAAAMLCKEVFPSSRCCAFDKVSWELGFLYCWSEGLLQPYMFETQDGCFSLMISAGLVTLRWL